MPIVSGVYSGLRYIRYPMTPQGATDLQHDINEFTKDNESKSIVSITLLPAELVPLEQEGESIVKEISRTISLKGYFYDPLNDPNAEHPYIPKNAKMFTAPYMLIEIDGQGSSSVYKLEKTSNTRRNSMEEIWRNSLSSGNATVVGNFSFTASAGVSPTPDIVIRPSDTYDNNSGKMNAFVIGGFPQLPYVIDSYRAYIASQGGEFALGLKTMFSVVGGVTQIGTGMLGGAQSEFMMGEGEAQWEMGARLDAVGTFANAARRGLNSIGNITAGLQNITGTLSDLYVHTHKGDTARGLSNQSIGMIGNRSKNIYVNHVAVNLSDAKKIDNFFSVYGYAVNQIEVPTFNARPCWNYIKTKQCNVIGEMPNEAIDKIKSIFNKGITWWKSLQTMLDYSQNNSPVTN